MSIDYLSTFNFESYIAVIDFTSALVVPSLYGYSDFYNRSTIIVVPDNLYEEWINASNWSAFIDFIYKESDCPFIDSF